MSNVDLSSSPLLLLPRELRDRIYHLSLLDEEFTFYDKKIKFTVRHGTYFHGRNRPSWMFACRQLCDEALTIFYKGARLQSYHLSGRDNAHPNQYFSVSRLASLQLELFLGTKVVEIAGSEKKRAEVVPGKTYCDPDAGLRFLLEALEGEKSSLKHLKIVFEMGRDIYEEDPYYIALPDPDSISDWVIDLSYLEGFGNSLENFEFVLRQTEMVGRSGGQHQGWMIVVPLIQTELIRLAKIMVSGSELRIRDKILPGPSWHLDVRRASNKESTENLNFLGLQDWSW
ncbi:hypothetical protein BDV96DRAFT_347738 [Lophiotrema nucula]|uniref:Uncharacterized protein n=1 Tax=Lophiotrema nucula TaxID=690887 RepID=A0A6A5ZKX4_9PLEO|nr:hypothetical protein BDV96DRAFT_347738 [Lophiotrema nucula]